MTNFATQAKSTLERQIALAENLLAILRQEYETLSKTKTPDLDAFASAKSQLVADLEVANQAWQTALRSVNAEFTHTGIQSALEKADVNKQYGLVAAWEKLAESAKACQKQNSINGAVLTLRSQVTEQALALLRGQNPNEGTYDPSGKHSHSTTSSGHTFGKA